MSARRRDHAAPGLLALACAACASRAPAEPTSERPPAPLVALERPGFRLVHPADWRVDASAPGYDPDAFFVLEGPEGATIAFMLLDEPADPEGLVREMTAEHDLREVVDRELARWGRYEGRGVDLVGVDAADVPAGLRAFAWSDDARSFLVAEAYVQYAYGAARAGFESVERTFQLQGGEGSWPAVSLGTPDADSGERLLVRRDFALRFPSTWRVDAQAEGYDPDAFFTLVSPYASAWLVIQVLEGDFEADALCDQARAGLAGVLGTVTAERPFASWGRLAGRGVALEGSESGLPSRLRVFAHAAEGRALVATDFRYDELAPEVDPDLERIASSFAFRYK